MEGANFARSKRRIYVAALACVLPFLPVVGLVQRGHEVGARLVYAVLTVAVGAALLGLLTRRMSLEVAERIIITAASGVVLGRVAATAWPATRDLDVVRLLAVETAGPSVIAVVLVIFLAMETRSALAWSGALWGGFTVALGPALVDAFATQSATAVALGRQSVTILVVVGLASALASLKGQLATERARASAANELANTDPLTGARNRRGVADALEEHLRLARRYDGGVSVALVDLDRFKARNDELGHAAGDDALVRIVGSVRRDLRDTDTLGRWGGDELLVVAPETAADEVHHLAERWRSRIADLGLTAGDATVTASIGVATFEAGDDAVSLLSRADRAMYAAKAAGGDRVVTQLDDHGVAIISSGPDAGSSSRGRWSDEASDRIASHR